MIVQRYSLGSWDPFKALERRIADLASDWDVARSQRPSVPPINLWTRDQQLHVQVLLPGYSRENIRVQVEDDLLTLSAQEAAPEEELRFLRKEMATPAFERKIQLPFRVDVAQAKAEFRMGLLTLSFQRDPHAQAQSIAIES